MQDRMSTSHVPESHTLPLPAESTLPECCQQRQVFPNTRTEMLPVTPRMIRNLKYLRMRN